MLEEEEEEVAVVHLTLLPCGARAASSRHVPVPCHGMARRELAS
jgi:hypothetical protein